MKHALTILMSLMVTASANAGLTVIHDTGDTISAKPYLNNVQVPTQKAMDQALQKHKKQLKQKHTIKASKLLYPANSDLTPGSVTKHHLNKKHLGHRPYYIIGADKRSIHWAKQNANYLKKIGAYGMITDIDDAQAKQKVEQQTGLTLMPVSFNDMSSLLKADHYPVLVKKGWVVQ